MKLPQTFRNHEELDATVQDTCEPSTALGRAKKGFAAAGGHKLA